MRNNAQIRIYENYAQSNLPNDKIVKFDPSDPRSDLIVNSG